MGDMATSRGGGLVGQIGRLFERGTVAGLPEGQILQRYAVHRDDAAFEALVGRHGSTVLGVCRRLLRDPNDVEDAFQATFVILVRKAGGLRDQEALGPWLHGVAYRVASRARADAARRRRRESPDERAMALALAPAPSREELRRLLDEEILRLPDKLRLPVVLCLLEGRTYDEAAHQLRWTVGMVRGRLAVARARLRDRLIRRGEAPSAALALVEFGALAVPPGLVASAPRITASVLSGKAGASSAVALANRTMRSWLMGRIATAALAWVAAGVALGVGSMGLRLLAGPEGEAKDPPVLAGELAQEKAVAKEVRAATPKRRRGSLESEIHPITIEGRALDGDGRPVAGASIVVTDANWMRSGDAVLGRGVSGSDGRFVLRDLPLPVLPPEPGPIPKPTQGRFEVAGSAPGLAFGWHAIQSYRPEPRPADFRDPKPGLVVFSGQPIVSDLVLGPPARVRGRVVDDRGHPVVGAATKASPMLALNPGETTTARFAFGKRAEPAAEAGHPEEDEVGGRLRTLWEAQARLIRRGRVRATQSFFNGDSIPPDHLRRLLESLGPDKVPPLLDLIRETFSEAPPGSTGMLEIVVDGPRRRQEEAGADLGPRHRSAGRRLRGHLRRLRGPGDPRGRGDRSPGSARLPRRFPAGAGQGREPPQAGVTRGPRRIPPRSRDDPWRALGRSGIAPAFGQSLLLCRIIPLKLILTPRRKKARGKPPWERLVGATPMAIAGSIEGGGQVRCGARMLGRAAPRGSEGGDRSRRGGRSSRSRWPRSSRSWAIGRGAATF